MIMLHVKILRRVLGQHNSRLSTKVNIQYKFLEHMKYWYFSCEIDSILFIYMSKRRSENICYVNCDEILKNED